MKTSAYLTTLGFVFGLVFLSSCAMNPVTGRKQFVMMTEGQEIAMAKNRIRRLWPSSARMKIRACSDSSTKKVRKW